MLHLASKLPSYTGEEQLCYIVKVPCMLTLHVFVVLCVVSVSCMFQILTIDIVQVWWSTEMVVNILVECLNVSRFFLL